MTDFQAKYFVMRTALVPALLEIVGASAEDPTAAEEAYVALELMGIDPCACDRGCQNPFSTT